MMPIGLATDIKIEGDKITCLPAFDPDDELAMKVYKKYEKGIYRMASVGAEPIEESSDPSVMLPGQYRPTITKWMALEVSITDIGANENALSFFGKDGRIQLSASNIDNFLPKIQSTMKLTAQTVMALALPDNYTEAQLNEAIVKLSGRVQDAERASTEANTKIQSLTTKNEELTTQLNTQKVTAMVEAARAAGKITEKQVPHYVALASASTESFNSTKALLDDMAAHQSITTQLTGNKGNAG